MSKKILHLALSMMLMMNLCGCFALFVGVAGGAGTAVWLSGKLSEEFHASYQATIDATKMALQQLNLQITKQTQDVNVAQFQGLYSDGRDMWIDIHRISDNSTKVEVRVGAPNSDKDAASQILKKIQSVF